MNDYYMDQHGIIRCAVPKVRLKQIRADREEERSTKGGRGNVNVGEIEKVKGYLRVIHPETARKVDIAKATNLGQNRVLIILNLLSGVSDDKKDDDAEFVPKDFLLYEDIEEKETRYGIAKDLKLGI